MYVDSLDRIGVKRASLAVALSANGIVRIGLDNNSPDKVTQWGISADGCTLIVADTFDGPPGSCDVMGLDSAPRIVVPVR
jgi:hypothetical protein